MEIDLGYLLGMKAAALTGDPEPFLILRGKAIRKAPIGGSLWRFVNASITETWLSRRTPWALNVSSDEASTLRQSVPTNLTLFSTKYSAASSEIPGYPE